jgi:DNA-directed RNA polymerase subunit omega
MDGDLMSLMQPPVDELLEKTENDKFLLCAVASERARDINDMMRGQRDRAKVLNSANQIAQLAGRKPLSLAMEEIERDEISYDKGRFHDRELAAELVAELAAEIPGVILDPDSLEAIIGLEVESSDLLPAAGDESPEPDSHPAATQGDEPASQPL